jgi:hypothetical protein
VRFLGEEEGLVETLLCELKVKVLLAEGVTELVLCNGVLSPVMR